jgi:2-oxoglutarate dehydrogenase E2 component (dihydrolipoamide succinyltransferase)
VLSPVVRRLIAEHDLNADEINGTGAGGRITRSDVLALVDSGAMGKQASGDPVTAPADQASGPPAAAAKAGAKQPPSAAPAAPPAKAPAAAPAVKPGERDEVIPFTRIRRATAEHMIRSKATSAHTLIVIDVDYLGVEKVRAANKEQFRAEEGTGLNYLPFVSRAVIDAIREFPKVNASVGDDQLIVHHYVNLGIAVDLNLEGLLVPVIRDADSKRLRAIAREIADLAGRARSKKLSVDELAGGTFTITNPGPFGTLITGPVINQPQIAILSTDGVKKRPVAIELPDGTDGIAVHPTGNLAIQFDHRAIDGAYASAFLAKVKEILETRDWSQEL